jgi:biotin transport system substrate-specific component
MTTPSGILARSPAATATLADVVVPAPGSDIAGRLLRAVVLVGAGAALTALSAQLSFKMPWTDVPYTGQTAAVLLVGTALGWRLGAASMLLYLLVGIAGVPVFSDGARGVEQVLGYTGGYLVAFVLAAALVGRLAERGWDRSPASTAALMVLGNLLIYAIGVPVLAMVTGMSPTDAVWNGALVFVPWDAFKVLVAAGLLPLAWRAVGRRDPSRDSA